MRYSQAFIPTLREVPADAVTPSHILLLRAGYIRMIGAGIYEMLPLGQKVLSKVAGIVRDEMDRAGAQEVLMPAFLPKEYFEETGRYTSFGDNLLRLKDRKGGEYHLGPTHEEIITDMVRRDVKSYRQLPLNLYQIQMKFRDEPRPRAGLLRCREFMMKDAYSFDIDEASALKQYELMRETYHRIFKRLGLDYRVVAADTGAMGGSTSAEFQVLAQNGEDAIVACEKCNYAANVEVAPQVLPKEPVAAPKQATLKVATPGQKTIDEVSAFLKVDKTQCIKSLFVVADGKTVLCLLRGDHEANEIKLNKALKAKEVRMAQDAEIRALGAVPGYGGPIGFKGPVFADLAVSRITDGVTGANSEGEHLIHAAFGRDFQAELIDIREVLDGDACPSCGESVKRYKGIEGGHIFVLGTHYSSQMKCTFLDAEGNEKPAVMGCYGIGVSRLVATAIEQNHDADGIKWPMAIAPYQVTVISAGKTPEILAATDQLYSAMKALGVEVLYDDRDERPGVKFKDADLLGIPLRVVAGAKSLADGNGELKARDQKEVELVSLADLPGLVSTRIKSALSASSMS